MRRIGNEGEKLTLGESFLLRLLSGVISLGLVWAVVVVVGLGVARCLLVGGGVAVVAVFLGLGLTWLLVWCRS